MAALVVFVLVFGATLPAASPFFLIHDAWIARIERAGPRFRMTHSFRYLHFRTR